jgi:hypothetical protein
MQICTVDNCLLAKSLIDWHGREESAVFPSSDVDVLQCNVLGMNQVGNTPSWLKVSLLDVI